ncbi:MAG: transporter [Candidatus Brocadiales bacterium]
MARQKILTAMCLITALCLTSQRSQEVLAQAPVNFDTAVTPFFSGSVFKSRGVFIHKTDDDDKALDRKLTIKEIPIVFGYAPTRDIAVAIAVPWIEKSQRRNLSGRRVTLDVAGLGDTAILGRWTFKKWLGPWRRADLAVIGGVELPTGDTNRRDEGIRLPPKLQLGSGSFDPFLRMAFSRIVKRNSIFAELQYKVNTPGALDFEFGDVLEYDLALAYRFFPAEKYPNPEFYGILELNGVWEQQARQRGRDVENTGSHTIFLSPGIQAIPLKNLLIEASVQIPIYQDLRGRQLGYDVGDLGDSNIVFGFRFLY